MSDRVDRPEDAATLADAAEAAVDAQRNGTAEALQSFANSIQEKAAIGPEGGSMSNAGMAAAERLQHAADLVHEHTPRQSAIDIKSLIRQRPIIAVGAGIAVGFLVGRLSK